MTSDGVRARILESAGEEFAKHGFETAKIREICDRVQANIAAVNYYFGGKEQLYVKTVMEAFRFETEVPPDQGFPTDSPTAQLRRYIHQFLSNVLAIDRQSWRHELRIREMLKPTQALETRVQDVIRPKFDGLWEILRRIGPEVDERRLHATLFSIVGQCTHYKMACPIMRLLIGEEAHRALDLEFLCDHISSFSLAALGLAPALHGFGNSTRIESKSGSK